jgi:hypothetical protein
MAEQPGSSMRKPRPFIGWIVAIVIVVGVFWFWKDAQDREAKRKHDIMTQYNWVVDQNGVQVYRKLPGQKKGVIIVRP